MLHAFLSCYAGVWIGILHMVTFLLRKIFHGILNEEIPLVETDSFRFPRKIFLKRRLTFRLFNFNLNFIFP